VAEIWHHGEALKQDYIKAGLGQSNPDNARTMVL